MLIYPQYNQTSWQGQDPFQQFSKLKEKINASSFPTKYRQEVLGLVTEFYDSKNNLEVKFTKEFEMVRDKNGQRHWIVLGFEYSSNTKPKTIHEGKVNQKRFGIFQKISTPTNRGKINF